MSLNKTLSEAQQRECCMLLSIGCDRQMVCHYLGISVGALSKLLRRDAAFNQRVLRAEATAELKQMQNLCEATKDPKNWRASVWWLETRSPERFARRNPQTVTVAELEELVDQLAQAIAIEVGEEQDRRRLLDRLQQIAGSEDLPDAAALQAYASLQRQFSSERETSAGEDSSCE